MSSTVKRIISKEIRFTFRFKTVFFMILFSAFISLFRYTTGMLPAAIIIPMVWCWLAVLSGSIKGYGPGSTAFFVSPVTRAEYVTGKYIFSTASAIILVLILFVCDFAYIRLVNALFKVPDFMQYDFRSLVFIYSLIVFTLSLTIGFVQYQSICGRLNYSAVLLIPLFGAIAFSVLLARQFGEGTVLSMLESHLFCTVLSGSLYIGVVFAASVTILLASFHICRNRFQRVDL